MCVSYGDIAQNIHNLCNKTGIPTDCDSQGVGTCRGMSAFGEMV